MPILTIPESSRFTREYCVRVSVRLPCVFTDLFLIFFSIQAIVGIQILNYSDPLLSPSIFEILSSIFACD
jgi:hypothetical protein